MSLATQNVFEKHVSSSLLKFPFFILIKEEKFCQNTAPFKVKASKIYIV